MIIDSLFRNINGETITLNQEDNVTPFGRLDTSAEIRNTTSLRQLDHGAWPTYTVMGTRAWRIDGNLFGSDSADYITKRRALLRVLLPFGLEPVRELGQLEVLFDGMSEWIYSVVTLESYELPMEAGYPAQSDFLFQWKAFDPVLYGLTTNVFNISSGTVVNAGEAPVQPVVVLNNPSTAGSIGIGTHLLFWSGLPALSSVTIDFKAKTAIGNDAQNYYRYFTGTWWSVPPGSWAISISGATASVRIHNGYLL